MVAQLNHRHLKVATGPQIEALAGIDRSNWGKYRTGSLAFGPSLIRRFQRVFHLTEAQVRQTINQVVCESREAEALRSEIDQFLLQNPQTEKTATPTTV